MKLRTLIITMLACIAQSYSFGQSAEGIYHGTIGKYPITIDISCNDGCNGRYYYDKTKKTIDFDGKIENGHLILNVSSPLDNDKILETFSLVLQNLNTLTGTWQDTLGRHLPVHLTRIDISTIKSPYDNLPFVKHANIFQKMRVSQMVMINDEKQTINGYAIQYYHIKGTPLKSFRFMDNTEALATVNDQMTNKLLNDADIYYDCSDCDYELRKIFIKGNVLSYVIFMYADCAGAAHPDGGESGENYNLQTGKKLELNDILDLSDVPGSNLNKGGEDATHGDTLMKLLSQIHPAIYNKPKNDDDCDYSDDDIWNYPQFWFTTQGLYISPSLPHVYQSCSEPDWSTLPYELVNKYLNKNSDVKL